MKNNHISLQNFKPSLLSAAVAVSLSFGITTAHANDDYKKIGDLEIYEAAKGGGITLTMMLDISGSMMTVDRVCANPVANNALTNGQAPGTATYYLEDSNGNRINSFRRKNEKGEEYGDPVDTSKGVKVIHTNFSVRLPNGKTQYIYCNSPSSRIEKLKQAMIEVVRKEGMVGNHVKLGVGTFPTQNNFYTGQIAIPAKELSLEHRWDIMKYISTLMPVGSTPAAQAYVEAGAYMLGTKTANLGTSEKRVITVGSMDIHNGSAFRLLYCGSASNENLPSNVTLGSGSSAQTLRWYSCNDGTSRQFPPFDHDMTTQTSSWLATIIPNRMDKLDFNLFPKFDVVYGAGGATTSFPATAMTNETAPRNPDRWRNASGQFASAYHFGRTIDFRRPTIANSGFPYSSAETKKKDGNTYQSPIGDKETDASECDGYGIYFLTDGEPNWGTSNVLAAANISLNKTGNYSPSVTKAQFPDGASGLEGYWNTMASYAKDLYSQNNPLKAKIKTAAVGFGSVFTPSNGSLATKTWEFEGKEVEVVDCDKIPSNQRDARNLCRLGGKGYGYGNGGFLATSEASAVSDSVIKFIDDLNQTIPTSPAGTISIPSDPLSASNIQPYAYLPMIQPEVGKNLTTWEGNLKKYHTLYGTLYGKERKRLYTFADKPTQGNDRFPSALNPDAQDIWQEGAAKEDNASVEVGGARNKLKHPTATNKANIRSVYVETKDAANKVTMVKVGVANGTTLVNFDKLDSRYTIVDMAYLVNYLGFNVPLEESAYTGTTIVAKRQALQAALANSGVTTKPNHGGVLHSVPVLASYGGTYDSTTGNITSNEAQREDHLLYGSMDGALHMVNARDGSENFAFIPRAMFDDTEQRGALKAGSTYTKMSSPKFGVDGPWSVNADYDFTDTGMRATKILAYGGLRMGGVGFYGLNITSRDNPTLAFSINKSTAGFERLGQTWSKPLVATIKTGPNILTDTKKVLIFGGGYDMCYENPKFKLKDDTNTDASCKNKEQTDGNAVYMIDAEDGTLLQTWTANNASDGRQYMKHSIVSDIVSRDRNNDGAIDHLYFSDLGGQVFRIDLRSGMPANNTNLTRRVVRLFDANANMPADHLPFRFYEKPAVSIHRTDGGTIGMVAISSGDRSSPTHKHRTLADANRIFGIIDRDVATFRGNGDTPMNELLTKNLTNDDLNAYVTKELVGDGNKKKRADFIDALIKGNKHGWFYTMTRFDRYEGVQHLKSAGSSVTRGNIYHASIYNPEYNYAEAGSCSAKILGGTERQLFCLPWGICAAPDGTLSEGVTNGTLGYIKAGPGIQELAVATFTDTEGQSTNRTTLVGQMTVQETIEAAKNKNTGTGGGGNPMGNNVEGLTLEGGNPLTGSPVPEENRFMTIKRWYDLAQAENIQ